MTITKSFLSEHEAKYSYSEDIRSPMKTIKEPILDTLLNNYHTTRYQFDDLDRLTYIKSEDYGAYTSIKYKSHTIKVEEHNSSELLTHEFNSDNQLISFDLSTKNWDGNGNYTLFSRFYFKQEFDKNRRIIKQLVKTARKSGELRITYDEKDSRISKVVYNDEININFKFNDVEKVLDIHATNGYVERREFNASGKLISRYIYKNNKLLSSVSFKYDERENVLLREEKGEKVYFRTEYKYDSRNRQTEVEMFFRSYGGEYPDKSVRYYNRCIRHQIEYNNNNVQIVIKKYEIPSIDSKNKVYSYIKLNDDNSKEEEIFYIPYEYTALDNNGKIIKRGKSDYFSVLLKDNLLFDAEESKFNVYSAENIIFFELDDFLLAGIETWSNLIAYFDSNNKFILNEGFEPNYQNKYSYLLEEQDYSNYIKKIHKDDSFLNRSYLSDDRGSHWDDYDEDGLPFEDYNS